MMLICVRIGRGMFEVMNKYRERNLEGKRLTWRSGSTCEGSGGWSSVSDLRRVKIKGCVSAGLRGTYSNKDIYKTRFINGGFAVYVKAKCSGPNFTIVRITAPDALASAPQDSNERVSTRGRFSNGC